jgi:hypothetical protein
MSSTSCSFVLVVVAVYFDRPEASPEDVLPDFQPSDARPRDSSRRERDGAGDELTLG